MRFLALWYRSNYGTYFANSELASPVLSMGLSGKQLPSRASCGSDALPPKETWTVIAGQYWQAANIAASIILGGPLKGSYRTLKRGLGLI